MAKDAKEFESCVAPSQRKNSSPAQNKRNKLQGCNNDYPDFAL
jgi:hypothetical protein